jgi:drug/metabolite transporter (DMT)-like permease
MDETWQKIVKSQISVRSKGINAALFSAFFLGLAPVFGKHAIEQGVHPLGVVAMRTLFATLLLFLVMVIFQRKYLYIYPAGLIGCLLAGAVNGIGSLFYCSALGKIDAGLGQMLYMLYPFFVAFWMFLDRQPISKITIVRLLIAVPAVVLLVQTGQNNSPEVWIGIVMMLAASILYAFHLPINQRVLFDIPAPTVTLYTLLAMSAVVVPTYLISGEFQSPAKISHLGA